MAHILVVDDDGDLRALLKTALERDGHQVSLLDRGGAVSEAHCRWADCILLDVMMPGEDGFATCRRIRALAACPILFLTAKTEEADVLTGLGLGGDDYLSKPFRIAELLEEDALSPAQRERVDAILRSASRIRDYMEQLRALTAAGGPAEAGGRATAELSALAEGWAAAGRGLCAPRGLRFSLDCPASRPCTLFRSELDRAVLNLLDNAARFTPPGGAVRLSAYVEEAVLTVAVEDSGPGFSPEALARAGRGFYTGDASRPREGHMGMGLTFARQVARRHGGTLTLSNTSRGARAALTLPL